MSTWVLLRGLTRESGHWGAFPQILSERLPGDRIVTLDLPGNGRLHRMPSPARIDATMQHCRQQLGALGVEAPFHLLAVSLGAMVAVEWARSHPDELASCVLVNTSLRPFSPWYQRLRPGSYAALLGVLLPHRSAREREQAILRLTTRHPPDGDAVVDAWAALREARPVSRMNALRQLMAAARYRAPARAPTVALRVIGSRGDALVDVRCSRRLAAQWGAEIVEHPSAGHDLALDDGPWLAEQVRRWRGTAG